MWKCVKILLLTLFLFGGTAYAQRDRKEELQKQKIRLQDEIALANKILEQTRQSRKTSLGSIEALSQKLKLRQNLISTLDRELEILDDDIARLQDEVDSLNKEIEDLKEKYAQMIRQARKSSNKYSRMMFLFSSKDFNQTIRRLEYLKQYSEFRRRQVQEIEKKQTDLNDKLASLNEQKSRKEALRVQMGKERSRLEDDKKTQESAIAEYQSKESELAKQLKDKQAQSKKLENEIQRIIAAEIRRAKARALRNQIEEEAKRVGLINGKDFTTRTRNDDLKKLIEKKKEELRAANKAVAETPSSPSYELTPEARQLAANFAANKSRLPWPVAKGLVVRNFGAQRHEVAKSVIINNNGIDIATEQGSHCRSAFNGEVNTIIRIPGAAPAIIINHGSFYTVYQNISEISVKKGDKVTANQQLGTIYTDEDEGRTILHFEIWDGQTPVDPLLWLARK